MHAYRTQNAASVLMNGQVLVTGGNVDPDNPGPSVELYNPATQTWAITYYMNVNRQLHTASVLPNGKVLIAGGANHADDTFNSTEIYDPTVSNWTNAGNMFETEKDRTASILKNGNVFVTGNELSNVLTSYNDTRNLESSRKMFMSVDEKVSVISKENLTTTND
jgi:N-acetylneuraminic acid mutarotase